MTLFGGFTKILDQNLYQLGWSTNWGIFSNNRYAYIGVPSSNKHFREALDFRNSETSVDHFAIHQNQNVSWIYIYVCPKSSPTDGGTTVCTHGRTI